MTVEEKLDLLMWAVLDIRRKVGMIMTAQGDIDAAVTAFSTILDDIQVQVTQLGTDVTELTAALQGAGAGVDTSKLVALQQTAAGIQASLDSAVQSVTALTSAPAAGRQVTATAADSLITFDDGQPAPADGTAVFWASAPGAPTGFSTGTAYAVINSSGDTCQLAMSPSGPALPVASDTTGVLGLTAA